jgi:hypothetical protein
VGIETSCKIPRECNFLGALGETVNRRHGAALLGVEPAEIGQHERLTGTVPDLPGDVEASPERRLPLVVRPHVI